MNSLIPFNFDGFKTNEAFWGNGIRDAVKRFRFTSRAVGDLLGAKDSNNFMALLRHRHPNLPQGVAFTVKATDGKMYETLTYDIWGVYAFAVESDLPGAKAFLRKFPDFILALTSGQIRPALRTDQRAEAINRLIPLIEVASGRERKELLAQFVQETGLKKKSIYHLIERHKQSGEIQYGYKTAWERRREKYCRPKWQQIRELAGEGKSVKEIASKAGVSVTTVKRVLAKAA